MRRQPVTIPPDLLDAIRERTGITAAEHVLSGVQRAMARAAIDNGVDYRRRLEKDPALFRALMNELTVGETYFLREGGQFDFIRQVVLPEFRRRSNPEGTLRAWSAGCATGEEAYSLAILGREAHSRPAIRVLGTDISEGRLAMARNAEYGEWSLRGVSRDVVERYFRRTDHRATVISEIRSMVQFRMLNLADADWSKAGITTGSMDLVFCRNVLIYLDGNTVARVARGLFDALAPDGWVFLGASDPILSEYVDCEVVDTGAGIAYRHTRTAGRSQNRTISISVPVEFRPALAMPALPAPQFTPQAEVFDPDRPATDAPSLRIRARQAYEAHDYARAADLSRELVALAGTQPDGWILLVRSLANSGHHDEAGLACAAGLDVNRTSPELTYLHAMLLRQAGKNSDALNALRCAVYLDRLFIMAHLAMGDAHLAVGDRDSARRSFRNAERLLRAMAPSQVVTGADGLAAGRLLGMAQVQLQVLDGAIPR